MAKTGQGVADIYNNMQQVFKEWENKAANAINAINTGSDIPIDVLALNGYHDARRSLETIQALQDRATSKGWVSAIRTYGVEQQGVGYDVIAETLALRTLLEELQATIITAVGGVDANGYITASYIKLTNTGPFFSTVAPVDYAPVVTKLQEIAAAITVD